MTIHSPATLHRQGKRDYNEDYLYPAPDHTLPGNADIFMVCDGVGLSNRGDYASRLVCKRFPDAYRVSQTGWSSAGEVRERWLTVGDDFYLDSQGWQRSLDSARFGEELALNKNLSVSKYITILKQGFPSSYDTVGAGGHHYLHVAYQPITRESLSAVLGNPSPMQGVGAAADLWIDLDTHLLAKAEVAVIDGRNGQRALFLQSFASYNGDLGVARPDAPRGVTAPTAY